MPINIRMYVTRMTVQSGEDAFWRSCSLHRHPPHGARGSDVAALIHQLWPSLRWIWAVQMLAGSTSTTTASWT